MARSIWRLSGACILLAASVAVAVPHWKPGPSDLDAVSRRYGHCMAFDSARQRVVLFGGQDLRLGRRNDTWECDGAKWIAGPSAPSGLTPREEAAMVFDGGRGVMVLFGGWDGLDRNDTWQYDGAGWSPTPRRRLD